MKNPSRPPTKGSNKRTNSNTKSSKRPFDKTKDSKYPDSKSKRTQSKDIYESKTYSDRKRPDDKTTSEKRPYKSKEKERSSYSDKPDRQYTDRRKPIGARTADKDGYDKPFRKYDDNRKPDNKRPYDKKPFRSGENIKNDNDRPVEKYVDNRKSNNNYTGEDKTFSNNSKSKRQRIVKSKTYEGRVREYKHVEILVKDNTYSKRPSHNQKSNDNGIRLNKFIANAGICSRREADTLIEAGAISINGKIVTQLGIKVLPNDQVKYGDQLLFGEQLQYLLLNKPKGYLTTTDDPQERKTVMIILQNACKERIYPVGRLDKNTTGLLLFTNDGELAKKLTHPKHLVEKVYHAELDKNLTSADMKKIIEGVELEDGIIKVDAVAYGETKKEVGIELHSGKNRIVRRIFESLGYEVVKLDRVVFAGLTKKDLPRGKYRFLSTEEVNILRRIR